MFAPLFFFFDFGEAEVIELAPSIPIDVTLFEPCVERVRAVDTASIYGASTARLVGGRES